MKTRLSLLFILCILLSGALVFRAVRLQLLPQPKLASLAKRQFQSRIVMRPKRGLIADRNGVTLAGNIETMSLAASPSRMKRPAISSRLVSKALDIPLSRIQEKLKDKRDFVWIRRHLTETETQRLRSWKVIESDGEPAAGFILVRENKRVYPNGSLAGHVLGDVNIDHEGLEGLELRMNAKLKGKDAEFLSIRDALGRPSGMDLSSSARAEDGRKTGAKSASAIVMDSVTGEILAMANEPAFDPNDSRTPADVRRNRAVTDGFEPGSTMKAVLLAAALSHGAKMSDRVHGERGSFVVQGRRISEAETHERFEWLSLDQMLKFSSNVGAAKLALRLGQEKFKSELVKMGFGSKTGVDFPGEISGRLPGSPRWQPLTTANVGFGQGILATPLQMLRAYAAFANGGWLVRPTLLRLEKQTPVTQRVFSEEIASQLRRALEGTLETGGTGVKARVEGIRVAGKTATAQMVDSNTGRYSRSRYTASFIGFPIGVEPKVVVFTSLTEPKGVYYATDTAAPLFKEILTATLQRLGIPVQQSAPVLASAPAHSNRKQKEVVHTPQAAEVIGAGLKPDGTHFWKMPSLHGLSAREALRELQGHAFQVEAHGSGIVQSQAPEVGKAIADGETVRLVLVEQ